ncbi:CBS domain-containing protein [Magnetospirillum sulfuroxidans]|uniref:CBS domain-containing protein n=1 Tax=Magnetospirillum sulfuroxidans TaxID=611300 RepID=A0ABS5IFR2_9PROT|nr:CBS domain-containing protein [Magnetospirillum sulfuroxidans]MBR9973174.1 CBS domain-containing protein [Magnetospirillum sulfuroxidans]
MSVEAILKSKGSNVFTIRPEHAVADAAALMTAKKVGVAVVCDAKGAVVGVVSERDIVAGMTQFGKGVIDMPVRNIMTSPVLTCGPGDSVKRIMEIMTERRIRHLPVVDNGDLLGMVSIGDAVNFRLREAQMETAVLRDIAVTR